MSSALLDSRHLVLKMYTRRRDVYLSAEEGSMLFTSLLHNISYPTHAFTRSTMFQVASHPVSFENTSHRSSHSRYEPAPSHKISLPRNLSRPQFTEVSSHALAAASPELASVPAEYVRRGLQAKSAS